MKQITKGLIYHLPTKEIAKRFLDQCDRKNIVWNSEIKASEKTIDVDEKYCIFVNLKNHLEQSNVDFYTTAAYYKKFEIVKWEETPLEDFKVGEIVMISDTVENDIHGFEIGERVEIMTVDTSTTEFPIEARNSKGYEYWMKLSSISKIEGEKKVEKELRFEIGDVIVVTSEEHGHGFDIGEAVKVVDIHNGGFYDDNDDPHYMAESLIGNGTWCVAESEVEDFEETEGEEVIKEIEDELDSCEGCPSYSERFPDRDDEDDEEDEAESQFKVGDNVKITDDVSGHEFEIGQIVQVVEVCGAGTRKEHYGLSVAKSRITMYATPEEIEAVKNTKLEVGDRVKFIGRNSDVGLMDYNIGIGEEVGQVGTFGTVKVLYGERGATVLADKYDDALYFSTQILQKVTSPEPTKKTEGEKTMNKFAIGDIIMGASDMYSITNKNMTKGVVTALLLNGKVVQVVLVSNPDWITPEQDIAVRIIEHTSKDILRNYKSQDFPVKSKHFALVKSAELPTESPKKPIILTLGDFKLVFNGDYTVVTDGNKSGVAKKHPDDKYDALEGLTRAVNRFNEKNKPEIKVGDTVKVIGSDATDKTRYGRHGFEIGEFVRVEEIKPDGTLGCRDFKRLYQTLAKEDVEIKG